MFVCGNVLIGIGDALVEIATKNGIDMEDTGGLFLARGAGQILATLVCADLYSSFWGNGILMACTLAVAGLWALGALIVHAPTLYLWFFMTGLMTATLDIGTQILTRRAYGTNYIETLRVQIHANCRIRRIYFSDRLYSEEELPPEFKLFLPIQKQAAAAQ